MASRGRGRRGRPRGASQAPPVFDQQAFAEAVGIAATTIAQASAAGSQCDAPNPGCPLTTRQPMEYSRMSGDPTSLTKIGQSLLCTGSSTQIHHLSQHQSHDTYMNKNGLLGP